MARPLRLECAGALYQVTRKKGVGVIYKFQGVRVVETFSEVFQAAKQKQ